MANTPMDDAYQHGYVTGQFHALSLETRAGHRRIYLYGVLTGVGIVAAAIAAMLWALG